MKRIYALIFLIFVLSACTPDPRRQAEADAMREATNQKRLDAEQARSQRDDLNAAQVADARRNAAVKDAALEDAKIVARWMTRFAGAALIFTLCFTVVSVGQAARKAVLGMGEAAARAAMVRANLIYLDPKTGNYPALLEYVGNGRYSMTDMNTKTTMLLDTRNDPDRLMVRGAMAVRHVGVLSSNAAKSKDAEGVSIIQPLILDAEVNDEIRQ